MKTKKPTLNDADSLLSIIFQSGYETKDCYEALVSVRNEIKNSKTYIFYKILESIIKLPLIFWWIIKVIWFSLFPKYDFSPSFPVRGIGYAKLTKGQIDYLEKNGFHFEQYFSKDFNDFLKTQKKGTSNINDFQNWQKSFNYKM